MVRLLTDEICRARAEVAHVSALPVYFRGDEDVAGLHVPVDEPRIMRCVERCGHLPEEAQGTLWLEPALAPEQLA